MRRNKDVADNINYLIVAREEIKERKNGEVIFVYSRSNNASSTKVK